MKGLRETSKIINYEDRKFRINKFDALTGSYIAFKLMSEIIPIAGLGKELGIVPQANSQVMSKADFFELQRDCLKIVDEMLDGGPSPVMREDNTWGIEGIEKDSKMALALSVQVLGFNVMGFFDEGMLESLAETLGLSRPDA